MYHTISQSIFTAYLFPLSFMFAYKQQMIIDLDSPDTVGVQQLENKMFLSEIVFQLTPDQHINHKLEKIDPLVPYLNRYPTIKTSFQLKQSCGFTPQFAHVAVGGTFDHLHIGHQVLLLYTALTATERITIGVTGEALLIKKKLKPILQPWNIRMKHVEAFVKSVKPTLSIRIFELNDPYGETVQVENMDALVISEETIRGGEKINEERIKRKMKPLELIVCPTISPQKDVQHKFSSTFVREYLLKKNSLTIEQYSEYRAFFDVLVARMSVQDRERIEDWWERLFLCYSEHWRHYHTNQHIFRLLKEWNGQSFAQRKKELSKHQLNIVELAIFFHDIVYRPDSKTNEEDSAQLASCFIKEVTAHNVEADDLSKQVILLILQTKNHEPSNALSQFLYDLDMGILNSPKNYQEYARGIKKEYHPLFGEEYAAKRLQLLNKWKEDKHFFSFQASNLASNLAWEIYCLQNHDL